MHTNIAFAALLALAACTPARGDRSRPAESQTMRTAIFAVH